MAVAIPSIALRVLVRSMSTSFPDVENRFVVACCGRSRLRDWPGRTSIAGHLVRLGTGHLAVPARVLVIVPREPLAHLDGREHAAHLDPAIWALPGHHRQRVVRPGHLHLP